MERRTKSLAAVSILLALLLSTTGCFWLLVGAGAGAGTIAYIKGESIRTYNYPMQEMNSAVQTSLSDLSIGAVESSVGELESRFSGTMDDGTNVYVKLVSKGIPRSRTALTTWTTSPPIHLSASTACTASQLNTSVAPP